MLTDAEIRDAISRGELAIEPLADPSLQAASYDCSVGKYAYSSTSTERIDVGVKGLLVIDPGEFVVVETLERVSCGPQVAAQLGLRSEFARQGLLLLSGPQIDPGFSGILVVRLVNLAPVKVTLQFGAPFLTLQFFALTRPVERPYDGVRQRQEGITPRDIQELAQTEGLTLGQVVKTLGVLAHDVGELKTSVGRLEGSVSRLSWLVPLIVTFGMAIVAVK